MLPLISEALTFESVCYFKYSKTCLHIVYLFHFCLFCLFIPNKVYQTLVRNLLVFIDCLCCSISLLNSWMQILFELKASKTIKSLFSLEEQTLQRTTFKESWLTAGDWEMTKF